MKKQIIALSLLLLSGYCVAQPGGGNPWGVTPGGLVDTVDEITIVTVNEPKSTTDEKVKTTGKEFVEEKHRTSMVEPS